MLDSSNSSSLASGALPASYSPALLSSSRSYKQRHPPRDLSLSGVAKNRSQSAGPNWEAEFAQYSDPEQSRKASQHLELAWKVQKVLFSAHARRARQTCRLPQARLLDLDARFHCRTRSLPLAAIVKAWAMSLAPGVIQQVRKTLAYCSSLL